MKTQIIIFAILLTALSCKAQTVTINQTTYDVDQRQDGMYLKDIDNILGRFIGTWKWQNGNSTFEVVFTKSEMNQNVIGGYSDDIVGKYKYIENGVLKANNLNETYTGLYNPIIGGFEQSNHNHLNIGFTDYVNHKSGSGYFELISGTNPQQAKWYAKGSGGAKFLEPGDSPSTPGFTLPIIDEIILVKQ
jgi:hypothetical protein